MYYRKLIPILLCFTGFFAAAQIPTDEAAIKAGEELFNNNCKSCHRVKQKLIGPALAGVDTRTPSLAWLKDWIRNPQKVIASGDAYANALYNEYNKTQMTAFTSFTDDQILHILAYVKAEEAKKDEVAAAPAAGGAAQAQDPISGYLPIIATGLVFVLVILIVILVLILGAIKRFLKTQAIAEEDKETLESPYTFGQFVQSPGFLFVVVFIIAGVAFKTAIDGLYSIGVQKNYQPTQPIAFSHKIHAGQYEINCQYCHTGAAKGKQSNIPSPNICMNCHKQIQSGTNTGTTEIAKIYKAVGFDPATGAYTGNVQPIEWVRIHNLPDLAYFNHSQHVNVAGLECQTCHGQIQEMDVVKQHANLTMGWCIDCHRNHDVSTKGNAYYDNLVELHQAAKGSGTMKVQDIGGLECSKCHY